jgi:hypothetical protein
MASLYRPRRGKPNGNESAMFRVIPAFESFRRTVSRVCGASLAYLFRPFRATDVCVFEGGGGAVYPGRRSAAAPPRSALG